MNTLKNIAVFCGSNNGSNPEFCTAARTLGELLANQGIGLVYGGGNMGVMRELARAVMSGGGRAIGVIPERLNAVVDHTGLTELIVVSTMHERKQRMYELADGFIILPGGIGTMEEFFEIFTWQQIGYHEKPIGLLEVLDFFQPLFALLDHMVESGFFKLEHRQSLVHSQNAELLLQTLQSSRPRLVPKFPERK